MKLHGKILTHFLSCNSPVDKEGYLYKKGERHTSYQRRWFTLKGNLLFYRDRPGDRDLIGVIVLEGCSVQLCESEEQFAFSLVYGGSGLRTYKFAAEDQKSQESWMKALFSASHSFLSLLLSDLEKQYEEIRGETVANKTCQHSTVIGPDDEKQAQALICTCISPSSLKTCPAVGETKITNRQLQAPPTSGKLVAKKSPKLWPKRNALVTPINEPSPPLGEWPLIGSGNFKDFGELHEFYGKEVKELRADWLQKKQKEVDNLFDFG